MATNTLTPKDRMLSILHDQPEDSSYDELLRELAMQRMIDRGLEDVANGKTQTHEQVAAIIQSWQA
jgi:predicted transcriptional regulator